MVATTSLPVKSCRRTALSLTALVVVAQLMTSCSLASPANRLGGLRRLQQLVGATSDDRE